MDRLDILSRGKKVPKYRKMSCAPYVKPAFPKRKGHDTTSTDRPGCSRDIPFPATDTTTTANTDPLATTAFNGFPVTTTSGATIKPVAAATSDTTPPNSVAEAKSALRKLAELQKSLPRPVLATGKRNQFKPVHKHVRITIKYKGGMHYTNVETDGVSTIFECEDVSKHAPAPPPGARVSDVTMSQRY